MKLTDIKECVELNESQRTVLLLALEVAAKQFDRDADMVESTVGFAVARASGTDDVGRKRLAAQYKLQSSITQDLRQRFEMSRWVKLGPVDDLDNDDPSITLGE